MERKDYTINFPYIKFLPVSEQNKLIAKWQETGDQKYLDPVIRGYGRFIHKLARKMLPPYNDGYHDVFTAGMLQLISCAKTFDTNYESSLLTYCKESVRNKMVLAFRAHRNRAVHIPLSRKMSFYDYALDKDRLSEDDIARIAEKAGIAKSSVVLGFENFKKIGVCDEEYGYVGIMLASNGAKVAFRSTKYNPDFLTTKSHEDDCSRQLDNDKVRSILQDSLGELPPRNREIFVRYFCEGESLAEIGRSLGISRERTRQVMELCRTKLRESLKDNETIGNFYKENC